MTHFCLPAPDVWVTGGFFFLKGPVYFLLKLDNREPMRNETRRDEACVSEHISANGFSTHSWTAVEKLFKYFTKV